MVLRWRLHATFRTFRALVLDLGGMGHLERGALSREEGGAAGEDLLSLGMSLGPMPCSWGCVEVSGGQLEAVAPSGGVEFLLSQVSERGACGDQSDYGLCNPFIRCE
jgi:hypothetical protein